LARRAGQPAIAAWVHDSDVAYIGAADAGGEHPIWLAIGEAVSNYDIEHEHHDPEIGDIRRHNAQ
jgi:hypothetical protein